MTNKQSSRSSQGLHFLPALKPGMKWVIRARAAVGSQRKALLRLRFAEQRSGQWLRLSFSDFDAREVLCELRRLQIHGSCKMVRAWPKRLRQPRIPARLELAPPKILPAPANPLLGQADPSLLKAKQRLAGAMRGGVPV